MNVEKLKAEHLAEIDLHRSVPPWHRYGSPETAQAFERSGGYAVRIDGKLVLLGGVVRASKDVGIAWAMFSRDAGRHMVALTRFALRVFEVSGVSRILADVECGFDAGRRWLELLGFKPLEDGKYFGPEGQMDTYVRVS